MSAITPEIRIEGRKVDYLTGKYKYTGGLTAASLQFTLPLRSDGYRKLWNKEVTFFLNEYDGTPLFRGYIKRMKEDLNSITVMAQDVIGYLMLGGNAEKAKIALTDRENLDGLTVGNAIRKALTLANLQSKVGMDIIGDTTPAVSSSRPPLRGTLGLIDIVRDLMGRAIDGTVSPPRPNIIRVVDDGAQSQLVIEPEKELTSTNIIHVFTENDNITNLKIINKKIPTYVIVNGKNGVRGKFSHDTAIEAYDRNYLEVTNKSLKSPAACVDFAQKLFRANLITQYEYGIETFEGAHLTENDIIRVETRDRRFSGNYRVRGKQISFSPTSFSIGLNINRKPPTLAEYIQRQDN